MTQPTISYAQPTWGIIAKVSALAGPGVTPDLATRLDDRYWRSHTGGGKAGDIREEYDGGRLDPDIVPSRRPTLDSITLTAPYKPAIDDPILAGLLNGVLAFRGVIWVATMDAQGQRYGWSRQYTGCLLTSVMPPESDATGEAAATWSTMWKPTGVQYVAPSGR